MEKRGSAYSFLYILSPSVYPYQLVYGYPLSRYPLSLSISCPSYTLRLSTIPCYALSAYPYTGSALPIQPVMLSVYSSLFLPVFLPLYADIQPIPFPCIYDMLSLCISLPKQSLYMISTRLVPSLLCSLSLHIPTKTIPVSMIPCIQPIPFYIPTPKDRLLGKLFSKCHSIF